MSRVVSRGGRVTATLALGSAASGLLAYVLFVLITRGLGATVAAPVSVLWTQWAFAGAAITFPLQHWITRSCGAGHEGDVRRAAPRVLGVVVLASLVLGGLAWLLRHPLFHRDDAWFPLMVVLMTLGAAAVGVLRGGLGGRGRLDAVAASLVAENAVRCVLVGVLLLLDVRDPVAHGLCLVAGSLVVLVWPSALRFAAGTTTGDASPFAFLGGAAGGQLVSQTVLTGAPVLLALLGGSPREVTTMFAALALFRAPYLVAVGSVPQLTLRVTTLRQAGEHGALRSLTRAVMGLGLVVVALAALLGALLGPEVLRLVFGRTVDVPAAQAAVLATGCALALTNLLLMVLALAQDRAGAVVAVWGPAVVVAAGVVAARGELSAAAASGTAFLAAEVVATGGLAVVTGRRNVSRA